MTKKQSIQLFEEKRVRTVWDDEQEKWYFCVVDVVESLTESVNATDYIKKMKKRDPLLAQGWGQIVTPPFCSYTRRQAKSQLRNSRGDITYYSVRSLTQGRTILQKPATIYLMARTIPWKKTNNIDNPT